MSDTALQRIIAHLGAAAMQALPSDDAIIMAHLNAALEIAKVARTAECDALLENENILRYQIEVINSGAKRYTLRATKFFAHGSPMGIYEREYSYACPLPRAMADLTELCCE